MKPQDCYWNEEMVMMMGSRINKIREFLRQRLITPEIPLIKDQQGNIIYESRPETLNYLYVLPAEGRNQIHVIDITLWTCTCQAYNGNGQECSHILACKLFLDQVNHEGRNFYEGRERLLDLKKEYEPQGHIFGSED